jgi:hypothetical protein
MAVVTRKVTKGYHALVTSIPFSYQPNMVVFGQVTNCAHNIPRSEAGGVAHVWSYAALGNLVTL